ncbi:F-box protein At4g22280-like [Chenopodium quinoa]|uniref:F-box protein At4g22280-like n=1 Tax=Chenopodium quinoa TaxID=63459 RepID=UPI000B7925B9|nr:F-box protein At4g22280-like [Chenopodium quinoa]
MPAKRKRSELSQLAAELAKRKTNNKTAPGTWPLRKCPSVVDNFSRLSDDIIVCHILSRLSLREAVTTSVLSRRWRNLWTESIGSKLIFSYPATHDYDSRLRLRQPILEKGISRILEVVKPTFDELTIRFSFNSTTGSSYQAVDRWVQIALENKVTRLHLDFSSLTSPKIYTFPAIHKISAINEIHNLRDVCLKSINVSGEVIDWMLSNCPSLERLAVWESRFLHKIRVCTESSKLKSLEFVDCYYQRIQISSPNLICLRYSSGFEECLQLDYVPLLSQLYIGSLYSRSFLRNGARLFINYISQLKRLKLDINSYTAKFSVDYLLEFPKLIKLEQLEVKVVPDRWSSHPYLWLIMLIKAAPSLQKFSIELNRVEVYPDEDYYHENLLNIIREVRHPSLKFIEMLKFSGGYSEMELGQHLLSISPLLEQLVVSGFYRTSKKTPRALYDSVEENRMQAQKFNKWLPPTAKLVIL